MIKYPVEFLASIKLDLNDSLENEGNVLGANVYFKVVVDFVRDLDPDPLHEVTINIYTHDEKHTKICNSNVILYTKDIAKSIISNTMRFLYQNIAFRYSDYGYRDIRIYNFTHTKVGD